MISKDHRFHGHHSLNFTYRRGKQVHGPFITLRASRSTKRGAYRAAVVVSAKVSPKAVIRNRIRRRVFEIVRGYEQRINPSAELIFTVYSAEVAEIPQEKLLRMVERLLEQAGVLQEK